MTAKPSRMAQLERTAITVAVNGAQRAPQASPPELKYDYDQVAEEHRATVRAAAVEIKRNGIRLAENLIAIGKQLIQVKEVLEYGQFGEWIETEFHWAERTAQQLMNAARVYGEEPQRVADLNFTISTIYLLAAPSTPEPARRQIEEIARSTGKPPTRQRAKQIVDAHKPPSPAQAATPALPKPAPLTLSETIAWLWEHIKRRCITSEVGEWLAWLRQHHEELVSLPGSDLVLPSNLQTAAARIEADLQDALDAEERKRQEEFARTTICQESRMGLPQLTKEQCQAMAPEFAENLREILWQIPYIIAIHGLHEAGNEFRRQCLYQIESLENRLIQWQQEDHHETDLHATA